MIVKCIPSTEDKKPCPMIHTCLARLTDGTITGCGVPLAYAGLIEPSDVQVEHTVRKEEADEQVH